MKIYLFLIVFILLLQGCSILENAAYRELSDGIYIQKDSDRQQKVFVDVDGDSIKLYAATEENNQLISPQDGPVSIFPVEFNDTLSRRAVLNRYSLDLDFLTVPAKFRPARGDVPVQLNSELNGMIYLGYRRDKYEIIYAANPAGHAERQIRHFGYSAGVFSGIGNTLISPTTTDDAVQLEYDGIIWSKGIAGIIAVNRFTLGMAVGFDNLLDQNSKYWIYEFYPWVGFVIGLNLN